jgi:Fe-S-cluster-containing hydrogenase component 2
MSKDDSPEIDTRRFVSIRPEKCTGCGLCEYVCSLEKNGYPNPAFSRIRVIRLTPFLNTAMTCRFCDEPPCVVACPRDALRQSEKGNLIIVNEDKCDGCGWCLQACPHGGFVMNPEKNVVDVCDLCDGEPKCVEFCPEEALEILYDDKTADKALIQAIESLPEELERLSGLIKKRELAEIFMTAEERAKKLESKLEELTRKK